MNQTNILIADDSAGVRRVLTHVLRAGDRFLLTAEDGNAALEMARRHLPDLIILDVQMPGRDGHEVCAALRADERTRMIPIMMLSGLGERDEEAHGFGAGADDYLAKPFNMTELNERVRILLGVRA